MHLKCAYYNKIQWITSIQGLILFSYISHQRKCLAHYRESRNMLLNIVLFPSENKTQNCCPFFKNQKMKGNAAYWELSRDSHTVTLSSAGDWLFVQASVTQSCPTLRYGMDCSALPHPSPSPRACSNSCPLSLGLS